MNLPQNLGTDPASYRLPIIDVDEERRNFDAWEKFQLYSLDDILEGEKAGTTETDFTNTDVREKMRDRSATNINAKLHGKPHPGSKIPPR